MEQAPEAAPNAGDELDSKAHEVGGEAESEDACYKNNETPSDAASHLKASKEAIQETTEASPSKETPSEGVKNDGTPHNEEDEAQLQSPSVLQSLSLAMEEFLDPKLENESKTRANSESKVAVSEDAAKSSIEEAAKSENTSEEVVSKEGQKSEANPEKESQSASILQSLSWAVGEYLDPTSEEIAKSDTNTDKEGIATNDSEPQADSKEKQSRQVFKNEPKSDIDSENATKSSSILQSLSWVVDEYLDPKLSGEPNNVVLENDDDTDGVISLVSSISRTSGLSKTSGHVVYDLVDPEPMAPSSTWISGGGSDIVSLNSSTKKVYNKLADETTSSAESGQATPAADTGVLGIPFLGWLNPSSPTSQSSAPSEDQTGLAPAFKAAEIPLPTKTDKSLKVTGVAPAAVTPEKKTNKNVGGTPQTVADDADVEWPYEGPLEPEKPEEAEMKNDKDLDGPWYCNRRWLVVLFLAGIVMVAALIATGLIVSQNETKQRSSASSGFVGNSQPSPTIANPSSPTSTNAAPAPSSPPPEDASSTKAPIPLTPAPTFSPTPYVTKVTTFAAIGDAPYDDWQTKKLRRQMRDLDAEEIEFVIHVGDIRKAGKRCELEEYENAAEALLQSPVPVFIVIGDNDWPDCSNPEEGLEYWNQNFMSFENNWEHSFNVIRQPGRVHNFAFEHKDVLYIGLNLIGGEPDDDDQYSEWETRLSEQVAWTEALIRDYDLRMNEYTGRVVLFGHADPQNSHADFFDPLTEFMETQLQNRVPILYINGDKHKWKYESEFFDSPSFLRIMLAGEMEEPPTIMSVVADGESEDLDVAFTYDRQEDYDDDDDFDDDEY